jgi:threonine synthase
MRNTAEGLNASHPNNARSTLRNATPLICSEHLSAHHGVEVWLKLECAHPTGSHKDRESALIVGASSAFGYSKVGCASTGNLAISLSYYAKLAGIECHVWVSPHTSKPELDRWLRTFGAIVHPCDGKLSELYDISNTVMKRSDIFNGNPGMSDVKLEGNRQIAREIREARPGLNWIVCPINNGSHFIGVAQGFSGTESRMVGVYSYSALAHSIQGFHAAEGLERIHQMIAERRGSLIEATDDDIENGITSLLKDGIIAEPSAASSVGILRKIPLQRDQSVCCIITGTGLKWP